MDQLKEFLRQAIKYRFWIAIGIAALLPVIAYFTTTGAMAVEEKKAVDKIKAAKTGVQPFENGAIKNNQWEQAVKAKTEVVAKDVDVSWRKLYNQQAPLLTWPEEVRAKFDEWGHKYPEGVDPQEISRVINEYIQVYPAFVDSVYKTFKPFDPETGTGIVSAPPKDFLLAPSTFSEASLPSLGQVWSAQEKLWIQRVLLEVVNQVNSKAKAKDWDSAPIKAILQMEVANGLAVDQKSMAKGVTTQPAPELAGDPNAKAAEKSTATASTNSGRFGGDGSSPAAASSSGGVNEYLPSDHPDQYYVVPVAISVFIEQSKIPDFLVEFQNSPMSIQVLDFELHRPSPANPVKKPKKGQAVAAVGGRGFMGGGRGGRGGMDGDGGGYPGGGIAGGSMLLGKAGKSGKGGGGMSDDSYRGGMDKGYNASSGGMKGAIAAKKTKNSKDVGKENLEKLKTKGKKAETKKDGEEETEEDDSPTASNPYFNVVEVRIKGSARFYVKPKNEAPAAQPESPGATPEPAKADAAKAEAPKASEPAKGDAAKAEPAKADAAKADAAKAEPAKTDAPPADMPKDAPKAGEAPKPDAAKTDTPKPEAPKPETPPSDAPKADAPKAETPKANAPAGEAPKADAPKADTPKGEAPKADAPKPEPEKGTTPPAPK